MNGLFAWRGELAGLAALRRRGAVRIARLVAILLDELRALFDGAGLFVGERRAAGAHALERRLRLVGPVALQVRLAVRRARHHPSRRGFAERASRRVCRRVAPPNVTTLRADKPASR